MRQVNYTGFGWSKVVLRDEHREIKTGYGTYADRNIKKAYLKWLRNCKSGGYFYILTSRETTFKDAHADLTTVVTTDEAVMFSRPEDAMMFSLQCL